MQIKLKNTNLFISAIKKYGKKEQAYKIAEELIELSQAIIKFNLNVDPEQVEKLALNVYEERSDVKIMLECFDLIFKSKKERNKIYKEKIQRLKNRIKYVNPNTVCIYVLGKWSNGLLSVKTGCDAEFKTNIRTIKKCCNFCGKNIKM